MERFLTYGMVFSGAVLMVCNIFFFVQYARFVQKQKSWKRSNALLNIPILLLVLFLLGYLAVGILGKPDLVVAGILFGGSIFVFIMYRLLKGITRQIIEGERVEADLAAKEEADQAKARFLASMSHEMRTPLNVIMGLDEVALRHPALPPETREQLQKIDLSAKHLLSLINNMLEMNQLKTGQIALRHAEFSLRGALDQVNAIAATLCGEKGLGFEASLLEGTDYMLFGDETLLKEVLLSLLGNAVKYTEPGGKVRFTVEVYPRGDGRRNCRFSVTDTGIGISPEFLPKMFEPFSREEDGSTDRYGGSGLSLAITKDTVELMEGSINVHSEKGVGSVFTVTIPMRCTREEKIRIQPEAPEVSLEGRRVLVVDDLAENREIVADLLELEGVEIETAADGRIAVEMVKKSPPGYYDAVLMDLRMPEMDGLEATRRIRALNRPDAGTMPIIALTANSFESDVQASLAAGMNEHLPKPADADLLYQTLKKHLALYDQTRKEAAP